MNDFTGKICPYCKTEFNPKDDIIVCSECDMPHHKECWIENQGCTTFGCIGTIKVADSVASSVTITEMNYDDFGSTNTSGNNDVVFCTQCGTRNANASFFCHHCGNKLIEIRERERNPYKIGGYNDFQFYQAEGIDVDVQHLIGTKTEYYVPQFQIMKSQGKLSSWNWSAFLVAPYWMMYRKMYGYAAAILVAEIFFSLINTTFYSTITIVSYASLGVLGNGIYMKYLEAKANQAKAMYEHYKAQFIASNGGVDIMATVLAVTGRVLLGGILLGLRGY